MPNRDVESIRSKAKFVATLRRIADALENGEPVRIQVAGKRLVIPQSAKLSVEHEAEGKDEEIELQFKWQNAPEPAPKPKKRAR